MRPRTVPHLKIKHLVQCSHQKLFKYYKNKSVAQNNMPFRLWLPLCSTCTHILYNIDNPMIQSKRRRVKSCCCFFFLFLFFNRTLKATEQLRSSLTTELWNSADECDRSSSRLDCSLKITLESKSTFSTTTGVPVWKWLLQLYWVRTLLWVQLK